MGSTRNTRRTPSVRGAIAAGAIGVLALAGCAGDSDEDSASVEPLSADTMAAGATEAEALDAAAGDVARTATVAEAAGGPGPEIPTMQVPGQAIAIEARAALAADDVRAAVDRVTTSATTRGGRVAAADVDYAPPPGEEDIDVVDSSRATLVLSIPPAELPAMVTTMEEIGTLTSFDQLAEDVTEQLADLDSRIANMRASVERVRALLDQAVDIDGIVRLEAELTARETELELLLASERQLEDRVAMSTLTVDITTAPAVLAAADDDPGVVDALAAGWNAFTTGLFSIALVAAAIAPFVGTAVILGAAALVVRRAVIRRRPAHQPVTPPPAVP